MKTKKPKWYIKYNSIDLYSQSLIPQLKCLYCGKDTFDDSKSRKLVQCPKCKNKDLQLK